MLRRDGAEESAGRCGEAGPASTSRSSLLTWLSQDWKDPGRSSETGSRFSWSQSTLGDVLSEDKDRFTTAAWRSSTSAADIISRRVETGGTVLGTFKNSSLRVHDEIKGSQTPQRLKLPQAEARDYGWRRGCCCKGAEVLWHVPGCGTPTGVRAWPGAVPIWFLLSLVPPDQGMRVKHRSKDNQASWRTVLWREMSVPKTSIPQLNASLMSKSPTTASASE